MSLQGVDERIGDGLNRLIAAGHRVIWWSDPDAEFLESVSELSLAGAELVDVAAIPALAVKRRVELESPTGKFVLYEPAPAPAQEQDWLLDLRLYAAHFAADATSLLAQDLGLRSATVRDHLRSRAKFFASKERTQRLQALLEPDDGANEIDAKIIAVLARETRFDGFTLILALLCDIAGLEDSHSVEAAPLWQEINKYGVQGLVWELLQQQFGYDETEPSLMRFVLRLFVTDLAHGIQAELPAGLAKLCLPKRKAASVAVFLSQWRDSTTRQPDYDQLAERVANELNIASQLQSFTPDQLGVCDTFVEVEKSIALNLRDTLLGNKADAVARDVRRIASGRMERFWANSRWPDSVYGSRTTWHAYYQALIASTELFAAMDAQCRDLRFSSPEAMYQAYTEQLFGIDQLYRHFHDAADQVTKRSPDAIAALRADVESVYLNGFLSKLARQWDAHLENGLLAQWHIPEVPNQQDFYDNQVDRYLGRAEDRRMYVIISDALRYEVADELKTRINARQRLQATLGSQLGVLPSYTRLGMASLLPHKSLRYGAKGAVLADRRSSDGLSQRDKVLGKVQGAAVKYETVMGMGKEALREWVKDYRVVYIYHNKIDAVGDTKATESDTWLACREAIDQVNDLVVRLVNNANATAITVTADHGFLFRDSPPDALDKSRREGSPPGTLVAKKRYLVGRELGNAEFAHHGRTAVTAGTECDTEFWLPKGVGRFHFVGGARFVHGGASLQEVVVPVINIRMSRSKRAQRTKVTKASASVLGNQHRITTNQHVFTLLQTEPVGDRVLPCTLVVGLFNQHGEAVSSTAQIRLDSEDADLSHRQTKLPLTLLPQAVQPGNQHYLILTDADTDVEYQRIEVRIDLAIENDFDF